VLDDDGNDEGDDGDDDDDEIIDEEMVEEDEMREEAGEREVKIEKQQQHIFKQHQMNTHLNTINAVDDLNLNDSFINVIEQHMPVELFMETPPLTGDTISNTNSTNSMCSTIMSSDAGDAVNNTTAAGTVVALNATNAVSIAASSDEDGERPLVLVIITDYNMQ